jgi:hypothetical protein
MDYAIYEQVKHGLYMKDEEKINRRRGAEWKLFAITTYYRQGDRRR